MTNAEKLREIENEFKLLGSKVPAYSQWKSEDIRWLINRVKRLTEALVEYCHCGYGEHTKGMKCNACKALESD